CLLGLLPISSSVEGCLMPSQTVFGSFYLQLSLFGLWCVT
ncbi:hypothetical protein A2U01_0105210, partial [Trifolium medium]|nr:hypothetical protein [Trifolium medium]